MAEDQILGLLSWTPFPILSFLDVGNALLSPEEMVSCIARNEGSSFIFPLSLGGSAGALLAGHMQLSNFLRILREVRGEPCH